MNQNYIIWTNYVVDLRLQITEKEKYVLSRLFNFFA